MTKGAERKHGNGQSMAVWYSQKEPGPPAEATLHFNLWHFEPPKGAHQTFLDVGLLLTQHKHVGDIFIYVPTKLSSDLQDLAPKLNDSDTIVGVFNEPLFREDGERDSIHLKKADDDGAKNLFARVWRFEDAEWTKAEPCADIPGTIIQINAMAMERARNGLPDDANIYFRFRIAFPRPASNPFVRTIKPGDVPLLSGFDRLECVDFRLNESRNLPPTISRMMSDNGNSHFTILQIHFLLATDVRADYVSGHRQFHKCRMLESGIWEAYAGTDLPAHMVIYHWKVPHGEGSTAPVRDFNAFLKFRIRESNRKTIGRFILFAALIGALGSYVSSYIPTFKNDDKTVRCVQDAPKVDPVTADKEVKKGEAQ